MATWCILCGVDHSRANVVSLLLYLLSDPGKMDIDDGYDAEMYRAAHGNPNVLISLPSLDALEEDPTPLPPK